MFWEVILNAKRRGIGWYESGEVFPGAVSGKELGLTVFKSKFGGQMHRNFKGEKVFVRPDSELHGPAVPPELPVREWLRASQKLGRAVQKRLLDPFMEKIDA